MSFSHPTYKPLQPGQNVSTSGEILAYAAKTHPGKTGLICGERCWSFAELDGAVNQFANAVSAEFSDCEGPVGIIGKNAAEYVISHFGAARMGRDTANFPTRCTRDELVHAINRTKPALLVVDDDCRDLVDSAEGDFGVKPSQLRFADEFWKFLANQPKTPPEVEIDPDHSGMVIFTGGTTGRPKAVWSSQRARAVSALAAVEDFRIDGDEIAGFSVPFTHTAGLFSWFQPAVLAGCSGVIIPKWDPELFMRLTETHGINVIFAVPAQLATLLDHPEFEPERLRSLRRIVFGGAPLPRAMIERTEAALPWMSCERAYGSTETGHLAAQIKADREAVFDGFNQPGGRLEIEIFKSPGLPAAVGEVGEVATRGAHLMREYLSDDEAGKAFFKVDDTAGDWGWMGDLAVRHEGYFSLVGRSKHMILSGGLNIYPAELEEVLSAHADVKDCAVIGIEDDVWGELPAAAIVTAGSGIDLNAILDHVSARVARHKRLRQLFIVEEIPRTSAGKIQVHKVRELCAKSI